MSDTTQLRIAARNMLHELPAGRVSQLPNFSGDGYSYGGKIIVSFDGAAIELAPDQKTLAHALADAHSIIAQLLEIAQ